MTYLAHPRINFYGKAFVNPPTANNALTDWNGVAYFDPANVALDFLGKSPKQFREWFHLLNYERYVNALWNYYGDNGIRFDEVRVISAELPDGQLISSSDQDQLIGSLVHLQGSPYAGGRSPAILVDLDPTDGFTTQLFAQSFSLNKASQYWLEVDANVKTSSRWINFWRNLAVGGDRGSSAMWHLAFPKEALKFGESNQSPSLASLQEAVQQGQGIEMRLCFYLFFHRPYAEIAKTYEANQRVSLPGSLIVNGTLGVWDHTSPANRLLMPNLAYPLDIPDGIDSQRQHRQFFLGTASAAVDTERKIIMLDLINSIPETAGFDTLTQNVTDTPEKINLGDLSLNLLEDGTAHCIGVIPFEEDGLTGYNKASTILTGGIIEMPYDPEMESQILEGDLVLLHGTDSNSPILLQENPYQVLIDPRCIYMELEAKTVTSLPFQVLKYGKPLTSPLVLQIEQTLNRSSRSSDESSLNLLKPQSERESSPPDHTRLRTQITAPSDNVVQMLSEITTDSQGFGVLELTPLRAGICKVWLHTPQDPNLSLVNLESMRYFLQNSLLYFVNVRVLPDDSHYDNLPDSALTWEFMYEHFFRYYSLLYPIMNTYINFDDPQQTEAKAALISAYVSEGWLDTTLYMPITRELSAGKRRLVQRWAKVVSNAH